MEGSCFHCKVDIYFQPSPLIRCFLRGICLLLLMLVENECADVPRLYYTFTSTLEVAGVLDMIQTSIPHGCWVEVHLETPSSCSETQALETDCKKGLLRYRYHYWKTHQPSAWNFFTLFKTLVRWVHTKNLVWPTHIRGVSFQKANIFYLHPPVRKNLWLQWNYEQKSRQNRNERNKPQQLL